ncbi:hypothetical protein BB560_005423, partial [Smittium megazygosporum]
MNSRRSARVKNEELKDVEEATVKPEKKTRRKTTSRTKPKSKSTTAGATNEEIIHEEQVQEEKPKSRVRKRKMQSISPEERSQNNDPLEKTQETARNQQTPPNKKVAINPNFSSENPFQLASKSSIKKKKKISTRSKAKKLDMENSEKTGIQKVDKKIQKRKAPKKDLLKSQIEKLQNDIDPSVDLKELEVIKGRKQQVYQGPILEQMDSQLDSSQSHSKKNNINNETEDEKLQDGDIFAMESVHKDGTGKDEYEIKHDIYIKDELPHKIKMGSLYGTEEYTNEDKSVLSTPKRRNLSKSSFGSTDSEETKIHQMRTPSRSTSSRLNLRTESRGSDLQGQNNFSPRPSTVSELVNYYDAANTSEQFIDQ